MRRWFRSEFTWRLYVVLQVATLVVFAGVVVNLLAEGELLRYRSVYEQTAVTLVEAKEKCTRESLAIFDEYSPETDPAKRLQSCIEFEMEPRLVGKEIVGIEYEGLSFVLILFMLAFVVPFAVVRVPSWLWEGWRSDGS